MNWKLELLEPRIAVSGPIALAASGLMVSLPGMSAAAALAGSSSPSGDSASSPSSSADTTPAPVDPSSPQSSPQQPSSATASNAKPAPDAGNPNLDSSDVLPPALPPVFATTAPTSTSGGSLLPAMEPMPSPTPPSALAPNATLPAFGSSSASTDDVHSAPSTINHVVNTPLDSSAAAMVSIRHAHPLDLPGDGGNGGSSENNGPSAPTDVIASDVSDSRIQVTWAAQSGVDHFSVERADAADGTYAQIDTASDSSTSYNDESINDGYTYYYRVIAIDSDGNASDPSASSAATTAPRAPDPVVATNHGTSITLNWTNTSAGADGITLEQSTDAWENSTVIADNLSTSETAYTVDHLSAGQTYYFRLRAFKIGGLDQGQPVVGRIYSDYSNGTTDLSAPAAPTDLGATSVGPDAINVTWTQQAGLIKLQESTDGDEFTTVQTFYDGESSITLYGLAPSTHYYFQALSNNGFDSEPSNVAEVFTDAFDAPGIVNVTASAASPSN